MTPVRPHVAIVGAGITGLVAGLELTRRGFAVTIFERWPDVGGQASAFDVGNGVHVDRYYHHLFRSDQDMRSLHDEFLPGELEWFPSSMGMYSGGRIWPFVSPRDLLSYGPISLIDRIRLGIAVVRLTRRRDWLKMDEVAALDSLRRACGQRAVDAVWRPLMLGKFGPAASEIPLAWLWSKLVLRRGNDAGRELLGYPRGSFQAIARAIASEIRARGGVILVDAAVTRVNGGNWSYELRCAAPGSYRAPRARWQTRDDTTWEADVVLFTTPTHITLELADWPGSLAAALESWSYRAAAVLLLELKRPLTSTYWINVADRSIPFLGLIEHTNLVPPERYPARYTYISNYVDPTDPLMTKSLDEVVSTYMPALVGISPELALSDITRAWWFTEDAAQPVPKIGNRHRLLPITTERRGFFIANTTQIYPEDRGTNYSARLGRDAARAIEDAYA